MKTFLIAILAVWAAAMAAAWALWRRFLPQTAGVARVAGLKGSVEIIRDQWGIPHIYAENEDDLFFAQGYAHAQDRFWQMDLQRRIGAGRLSEVLGERTLEVDRFTRTLGLGRAAEAEWAALDGDTRRTLEAYAAGVNALMAQRRGRLSLEFTLLRYQPEAWRPVDTLYWAKVMSLNLGCNWTTEIIRSQLTARLGAELAADLEPPYPADNPVAVTGGPSSHDAASPPNGWGSDALRQALQLVQSLLGGPDASSQRTDGRTPNITLTPGASNQWVISGQRSATGQPLLANDTHLAISMPGLFYQVHLNGGRYHVTGVSFPGVPGVVVGHNEHCAWGLTTAWQDAQDLFIERLNPANPRQVEVNGRWQDAQVVREEIRVKGRSAPEVVEVTVTRHGPIISDLVGAQQPLALRWVALEPTRLAASVLAYNRAQNWDEFRRALADWATPAHNFVYADTAGHIGFLQAGRVPVRQKGSGMAPVPGWTDEFEWLRYLTLDELPQVLDPDSGWIGVANNLVVDAVYPHFLSADLENPCRATRIAELVTGQTPLAAEDFGRFQLDTYSAQAKRFVRHMVQLQPTNAREAKALDILREWDFHLDQTSVAATLYHVTRLHALHVVFDAHLGDLADRYIGLDITPVGVIGPYHGRSFMRLLDMLDNPKDTVWLVDPQTGVPRPKQEIVHRAFRQTLKALRAELGDDMDTWTWGRVNQVRFAHPLGSVKPLHLLFNRGPFPMSGDHDTLLRASGKPVFPFEPVAGAAAMRFIADVSDWEQCHLIIPGGQSGHVASRHYADLISLWRDGVTLAMPFGREAVERAAKERLTLIAD